MADLKEGRPYYNKLERQKFACIVYSVTAVFLVLALVQWFLFYYFDETNTFFRKHYWVGIIFFSLSLLLVLIFIFFESVRFIKPLNWLIAIIIYECIVVGVTSLVVRHYMYHFLLSYLIWSLVLVIFLLLGSFIPHDLTLDIVVLVILGIICIIGAMYFLMLYMVANVPFSFYVYRIFIVLTIVTFVMYHAQIINGGRFAEIRDNDYLLAALILFYDFLFMFLFTFQMAPRWSDLCDAHLGLSQKLVLDHHIKGTTSYTYDPSFFPGLLSEDDQK